MKKTIVLLIAAMMLLGAVKGMAATEQTDSITSEFSDGKLDAAEFDSRSHDIDAQIEELGKIQDSLFDVQDSGGLIRDIGHTVFVAKEQLENIRRSSDLVKVRQLNSELKEMLQGVKAHLPR